MNREINLLPPDFQVRRRRLLFGRAAARLLGRLDAGLILVALLFISVYFVLRFLNTTNTIQSMNRTESPEQGQQVQQVNELLTTLETGLRNTKPWTPLVAEVLRVLPPELTITSLTVSDTTKNLTVEGVSRNRAAVVAFEQAVRRLPQVASVEAPLQNFATGSRAAFTLNIRRTETQP